MDEVKICQYCSKSFIGKDGKLMNEHNIFKHKEKCKTSTKNKKRSLNTMDKFFTPKKKCVNENDDIQVVKDSDRGKSVLAESAITVNEDNQDSELALTATSTTIPEDDSLKYCQGLKPFMKNIFEQFPFQLIPSLDDVVFEHESFHHTKCKNVNYVLPRSQTRSNIVCANLADNPITKSIISRSSLSFKDLTTYHNQYLNHQQLTEKSNNYFQNMQTSRLHIMNMQGKINRLGETLDMHQRFLLNIAQHNIPRLKELVTVALRNNRSIYYITSKVVDAIDGVYMARPSQEDKDLVSSSFNLVVLHCWIFAIKPMLYQVYLLHIECRNNYWTLTVTLGKHQYNVCREIH